jgi:hypothetical protein
MHAYIYTCFYIKHIIMVVLRDTYMLFYIIIIKIFFRGKLVKFVKMSSPLLH